MSLLQLFVLSVVQGITEFLPISSSAHLVLVPALTGWPDQGLALDVAVHIGTLGAVVAFFWRDVVTMLAGCADLVRARWTDAARLTVLVVVATVPVVAIGLAVKLITGDGIRSVTVIAWTTVLFAIVLYLADRYGSTHRTMDSLGLRDAVLMGLAQAIALVPGTSRSGICITAARMLGFQRTEAARFSMLMSIPTTIAAGTLLSIEIVRSGDNALRADSLMAGGMAFVAAFLALAAMMRWLRLHSFTPFVVYRLLLGLGLLAWVYLA